MTLNATHTVIYKIVNAVPWGVPYKILTVQERWTWCCWVMMMAKGVRDRPTSSSA